MERLVQRWVGLVMLSLLLMVSWIADSALAAELLPAANPVEMTATEPTTQPGAALFELHCAGCHINGGNIVRRGKDLKQKTLERNGYSTVEAIAQIVTQGKGNMSAYGDRLTPSEIETVSAYVLQKAAAHWK